MNEQDPIMIFAGYDKSMNEFMAQNAGLLRRFGYQFKFDNYDALSIAKIFALKLRKSGACSPDYLQNPALVELEGPPYICVSCTA